MLLKKWKENKTLIISVAAIAALATLSFFLIYLLQMPDIDADSAVSVRIEAGDRSEEISLFREGERLYAFLPSDAEYLTLEGKEGYDVRIDGLEVGSRYSADEMRLGAEYSFSAEDKHGDFQGKLLFMKSEEIPSLFISTESGAMDYVHAVKGNSEGGEYTLLSGGESTAGGVTVRGRGNTSWTGCEKKGYRLTLDEEKSLLGLAPSSVFLLIANARCNYLSNTVAFWLSEQVGVKYVPDCRHIDLYLNGEYAGNYILCEQITVSESSIDITDMNSANIALNPNQKVEELVKYEAADGSSKGVLWVNEPEDVTGGFFLERDVPEYYADEVSGFVLTSGDHFVIKGPKYAGEGEVEYIKSYVQAAYDALSSADGYHPTTGLHFGEYIDIESFVLKYVIEEFLNFNDAGRSSAYYYKDAGGLLCAGPGWDFEGAFKGDSKQITRLAATEYSTDWYERLLGHEDFRLRVADAYRDLLRPALLKLKSEKMPYLAAENSASAEMDEIRWAREDFGENCVGVVSWIDERIEFLDEMWLSGNEYVTVTVKSEWQNSIDFYLKPGERLSLEAMPEYVRNGFNFAGWYDVESGEIFDFNKEITADITLEAAWARENVSLVSSLLSKASQVIPEIIFIALFGFVFILFTVKFIIKEKKK